MLAEQSLPQEEKVVLAVHIPPHGVSKTVGQTEASDAQRGIETH